MHVERQKSRCRKLRSIREAAPLERPDEPWVCGQLKLVSDIVSPVCPDRGR